MIPTRDEHTIFSKCLCDQVDWERLYNDTSLDSKKLFTKDKILYHIRQLILKYPSHYDTSSIEGRIESTTTTLCVKVGLINKYYYIISQPIVNFNGMFLSWFMTDKIFLEYIDVHKKMGKYCVMVNINNCLRQHKINKICHTLTQTTNSIQG